MVDVIIALAIWATVATVVAVYSTICARYYQRKVEKVMEYVEEEAENGTMDQD